jgi:hypothetical protein
MEPAKIIAEWAKKGAAKGDCGRMCSDCAFRSGTEANRNEYLIENIVYGVMQDEKATFYCHHLLPEGILIDKTKVCAGFQYARQYFKVLEK